MVKLSEMFVLIYIKLLGYSNMTMEIRYLLL